MFNGMLGNHDGLHYLVVNGGSDQRSELGVFIFPRNIPYVNNGEPAMEL